MMKLSMSKVAVALGGLALTLSAGAGVAAAQPDLGPAINSTCTYDQWVAALRTENPGPASAFDSQPMSQSYLRQFFSSGPAQRQQLAQMFMSLPGADQNVPVMAQAFNSCSKY
ncbi:hemophore-related protein [Mycobacterium sp. NPDC050041]|uniref:hemophore-related protein n=1 Tax=Mycobacterium sp. NPDC050041 TaxID=3364293 RepID=UPI003C2DC467